MSTKVWSASFLDPALNFIKSNTNKMVLCSAEPTTYTQAVDNYALADVALASGDFSGPSNGFASGRRLTIAQKDNVTVDATGTAKYMALVDTANLALRYVGRITDIALVQSSIISIGSTTIELADAF